MNLKFACLALIITAVSFFIQTPVDLFADEIADLNKRTMYIREGFNDQWISKIPTDITRWKVVPGKKSGNRQLTVNRLGLKGTPERNFLQLKEVPPGTYTFVTSFTIPDRKIIEERLPGLLIRQIAENWEIYLNGILIDRVLTITPDGTLETRRTPEHLLVRFHPEELKVGENILAFKIVGDPTYTATGFYRTSPFVIDDYTELIEKKSETGTLLLIAIYLFVGIYHLILFLNYRREKYNLYFGLFTIILFCYLFARTNTIDNLISDSFVMLNLEFCSLYALLPLIGLFFDNILFSRTSRFIKGYALLCASLILCTIPVHLNLKVDILRIWQYTALVPLMYFLIFQIGTSFINTAKEYYRGDGGSKSLSLPRSVAATMTRSVPGNLLIGTLVLFFCAVFDIIDALFMSYGLVLTRFGFFFFIIGMTIILSNRFIYIHRRIEGLNRDLQNKIDALNAASIKIGITEERYKILVEGTNDYIFSLDSDLNFISANKSMLKDFPMDMDPENPTNFMDLFQDSSNDKSISDQFAREKIDQFLKERKPANIQMEIKTLSGRNSKLMNIYLEHINIEDRNEILGKATNISKDSLLKNLDSESQVYTLSNYLFTADDLSLRITRNLEKYMDHTSTNLVRIALREILINAIEHGNLSISFDDKTRLFIGEEYINFINMRQQDPKYRNKKVHVEYFMDNEKATYIIEDEGNGFNSKFHLEDSIDSANSEMLTHGRGLIFARNVFDEIEYNEKGNKATIIKYFKNS